PASGRDVPGATATRRPRPAPDDLAASPGPSPAEPELQRTLPADLSRPPGFPGLARRPSDYPPPGTAPRCARKDPKRGLAHPGAVRAIPEIGPPARGATGAPAPGSSPRSRRTGQPLAGDRPAPG